MVSRGKLRFLIVAWATMSLLVGLSANAAPVAVDNFSFEEDILPQGFQTDNAILDWVVLDTRVPFQAGAYHPLPGEFNFIPDGDQVALLSDQSWIRQELGVTFQENFVYQLSVWVGLAFDAEFGGSFIGLYVVGDPIPLAALLNDSDVFLPGEGNWEQQFVSYTYDPADIGLVGLPLEIRIASVLRSGTTYFDFVQLDATVIPEPSSLGLGLVTVAGLAGLRWSRRRRTSAM